MLRRGRQRSRVDPAAQMSALTHCGRRVTTDIECSGQGHAALCASGALVHSCPLVGRLSGMVKRRSSEECHVCVYSFRPIHLALKTTTWTTTHACRGRDGRRHRSKRMIAIIRCISASAGVCGLPPQQQLACIASKLMIFGTSWLPHRVCAQNHVDAIRLETSRWGDEYAQQTRSRKVRRKLSKPFWRTTVGLPAVRVAEAPL